MKLTRLREALEGGTAHQIASGIMDGSGAYQAISKELDLWYGGEHRFLEQQEREIISFGPSTTEQDVQFEHLQQFTLLLRFFGDFGWSSVNQAVPNHLTDESQTR